MAKKIFMDEITFNHWLMLFIKEVRVNKGIKQSELARVLNISQVQYSDYENSVSKISLLKCIDLFNYLQIPLEKLQDIQKSLILK